MRSFLLLFIIALVSITSSTRLLQAGTLSCDVGANGETPDVLKARLEVCQAEIEQSQAKIDAKGREATSLQRDIAILDFRIQKAKLEIKQRNINILNLENDIHAKNTTISTLGQKIDRMHVYLSELLRKTSENDRISIAETMLSGKNISEMFADAGAFNSVQEKIDDTLNQVRDAKAETEASKKIVQAKKQQEAEAKQVQVLEQQKATLLENQKNQTLKVTKGQEAAYKKVLADKQKVVAEIKNRMIKFTGGNQLKFGEALVLVRVAESKIGVRAAFVLAVLTQESGMNGVIGGNLGKCFYNTAWKNKAGTVMSATQKPSFLALITAIGKDPNTTPVSCPIVKDGQYGGAMGPAQFMPTTWWDVNSETGVQHRVEAITGNVPASPFNNEDAFTATAVYLNDGLQGCKATYSSQYNQEACAAAKYYAGGNWKKHMKGYGASVASRAASFQKDIDILDSQ
jgi:peptidoglycan hydrolase CwlO-like protein